ncbi:ATP-dependent DNA helicase [Pleionea sp. CnH1-48]|uniref:ATP-dependent DNA helicase n=1 Tax=Pleionea sp. CnH1-48 TaxID=2954494 RepID=UPI002096E6F4|nr:ATP-dependent DNA helicase [Pleionea sp. CnH1-48]MCO7222824.1 ATP-dependent DNA helicase [Pleionea sp. CnH1-48]
MQQQTAAELLSDKGPFKEAIKGFSERQSQQLMAQDVESALDEKQVLLVEAGTGTGKTYSYLVPALMFDGRVVISTGTRNLQDQLVHKDLPNAIKALKRYRKVALLKGRQNYLCLHRMDISMESGRFTTRDTYEQLVQIRDWSAKTKDGDLSQVHFLPDDSPAIPFATSSAENCLGSECPSFQDCFVAKARRRALEADIVVVNHHLLMADLVLKEDGFGELLPHANAYIVDEAHQLPDVATAYFGQSVTTRQLMELARDSDVMYRTEVGDSRPLLEAAQALEKETADFRLALGDEGQRQFWHRYFSRAKIKDAYEQLVDTIKQLKEVLLSLASRSKELENLAERASDIYVRAELFCELDENNQVQWVEVHRRSFMLNSTPLNVAEPFQKAIDIYRNAAWVFTSATLAISENFEHFRDQLGWRHTHEAIYPSPFDYRDQSLFYLPRFMGNPSHQEYTQNFIEQVIPLLKASGGRAFLLFTSHRALHQAAKLLEPYREFDVLVQGSAGKTWLLEKFRQAHAGVLLGTYSFWEGVDVVGDALSFVAIDKLPFGSPGDPVTQARIKALRNEGKDPFRHYQLPEAIIALKQGAGRLIRDVSDKGLLMIGDPRLCARDYGHDFIVNLPDMTRTRHQSVAQEYLEAL